MKPLLHSAHRFITASTAPIVAACALSGAALVTADALTSSAAAAPALIVQLTPATQGASMANSKQEARRPGIKKIFAELQRAHPTKAATEIAVMARIEWGKRNEQQRKNAVCPTCGHKSTQYPTTNIVRAPYAREGYISGTEKSEAPASNRDSAQTCSKTDATSSGVI